MNRRLLLLPVALWAAACMNQGKKPEAQQPAPYKFPHSTHIEAGLACTECHASVLKSSAIKENVIDVQIPKKSEACAACHDPIPDYKPVQRFEPAVNFSHAWHVPMLANDCGKCHVKFTETGDTLKPVPPMTTCTACHNHAQDFAVGRCTPCHISLNKYAFKPVKEYTHEASFLETHGKWARQSVQTCTQCHDQTMCSTCHTATTRPIPPSVQFPEKVASEFIHRGDWISRHAMEQAADPASCQKCHGPQYCQSCHAFQNVSPSGANPRDPHPQNWLAVHGTQARLNILACAACHDQGSGAICVACHRSGGVNPHPPGWKGTQSQIGSNPTCRACHS
jgi:hypothetical protein